MMSRADGSLRRSSAAEARSGAALDSSVAPRARSSMRPLLNETDTVRMADLDAIEARIWSILAPYRDRRAGTIYGVPSLTWPGRRPTTTSPLSSREEYVSLYLVVANVPMRSTARELLKRRSVGLTFAALDDSLARWTQCWRAVRALRPATPRLRRGRRALDLDAHGG